MADNTILNLGSGGDTIATKEIAGVKHELVILEFDDGIGGTTEVSAANPLPVLASIDTTGLATSANQLTEIAALASIAAEDFATEITLSGIDIKLGNPLPLPTGAATVANQQTDALTNTQLRLTPVPVSGTVSTGGLTDTQLRATPVPVSGTVTVDTALLATSAKQDTGNASLAAIDAGIPAALGQTAMAASMPVTIASNQSAIPISGTVSISDAATDNTVLYNDSLSASGATEAIITTGYQSICIQIYDAWSGNITIEGSNDDINYVPIQVLNIQELSSNENIYGNGNYIFKVSTRFFRINARQISGTASIFIVGRTTIGMSSSDALSMAMDRSNNTPLYIEETASKKDPTNALIPSDAIQFSGTISGAINSTSKVIDTAGYNSITVQLIGISGVPNIGFQESNDLSTWSSCPMKLVTGASIDVTATNTSGTYVASPKSRYFRIIVQAGITTTTTYVAFLRQQPVATGIANINISTVGGTVASSAGSSGVLAVGGNTQVGLTINEHPLTVSGVDSGTLVRRLLTDTSGRLITALTDQTGTARALGGLSPNSNPYNIAPIAVTDTSQFEGQSFIELLGQLLIEMKINNQYLYDLPIALQRVLNDTNKNVGGFGSEPQDFRNDPTMFAA